MKVPGRYGFPDIKSDKKSGGALRRSAFSMCLFLEAVLQADAPIKDQMAGSRVLVQAEISLAQELEAGGRGGVGQAGFHLAASENLQRIRVQAGDEILVRGVGLGSEKRLS